MPAGDEPVGGGGGGPTAFPPPLQPASRVPARSNRSADLPPACRPLKLHLVITTLNTRRRSGGLASNHPRVWIAGNVAPRRRGKLARSAADKERHAPASRSARSVPESGVQEKGSSAMKGGRARRR